ncbi:MAG: LysR family transcriptional regulator [Kiloniellales bacterium]
MQDLSSLAVFARVVEAGGFSAAAGTLGLSKSAVSKQVSRLEARLGIRLLNRTTRRLSLTEAGALFYEGCQRMVAEAEAAEAAVTHLAAAPRGTLRVNAPVSFAMLHLVPILPELMEGCPELSIDLTLNDRRVDLVEEGYDVAVRIGRLTDSSLIARRLAPSRSLLCAAPAYLERHGTPQRPEDLARHNCLIYTYQAEGALWRFQGPEGAASVRVTGRLQVNNGDALCAALLAGAGIGRLPTFIAGDALRAGRLLRLLPDWPLGEEAAVHAVYPAGRAPSPKIRVFIDFLAERFGEAPYWDRDL